MKDAAFYNVDSAVGMNGANKPDDVMLVQCFLRLWSGDFWAYRGPLPKMRDGSIDTRSDLLGGYSKNPVAGSLNAYLPEMDGRCDGVTQTWIQMFQMAHPGFVKLDGRVDPATPSLLPAHPNTIMLLNQASSFKELPSSVPALLTQAAQRLRP
jgi:hypothetical protein